MKSQIISSVVEVLETIFRVYENRLKEAGVMQFKKLIVANKIRKMPKFNIQPSKQTNFSSTESKNYASIVPIQNTYSSIQIMSSEGFNFEEENKIGYEIDEEGVEILQKADYIEKYFNQTKKIVEMIETSPFSEHASKDLLEFNPAALSQIQQISYSDYFERTIQKYRNEKGQVSKKMNYTTNELKSPLTRLHGQERQVALEIFQYIQKYDGFLISSPKCVLAANLSNRMRNFSQELIEEIYFQILKQMKGRFYSYFKLLIVIIATIKVPLRLYWPLLNYFLMHRDEHVSHYSYAFNLMTKIFEKPREIGIFPFEADLVMCMRKIPVTLDFPTQKIFYMQTTSRVQDLIQQIVTHFELDKDLSEYLISYKYGLFDTGNLFDLLYQVETKRYNVNDFTDRYELFTGFKVMITYKNLSSCFKLNPRMTVFYAYQSKKYLSGIYSLRKRQIATLSALKYYCQNDSVDSADIALYVPRKFIQLQGQHYWAKTIVQNIKNINCTKRQARRQFLRALKRKDCFMAHVLFCNISITATQQYDSQKCFFFLGPGFLHFLGIGETQLYQRIRMNQIKQYGGSRSQLCINYKTYNGYKTARLSSQYQKLVNTLFYGYIQNLKQKYFKQMESFINQFQKQQLN